MDLSQHTGGQLVVEIVGFSRQIGAEEGRSEPVNQESHGDSFFSSQEVKFTTIIFRTEEESMVIIVLNYWTDLTTISRKTTVFVNKKVPFHQDYVTCAHKLGAIAKLMFWAPYWPLIHHILRFLLRVTISCVET